MISRNTPKISVETPMMVSVARRLMPKAEMSPQMRITMVPSTMAFSPPVTEVGELSPPTIWKPDQTPGKASCMAIAMAETLTI
jgi:hypothetical protein